MNDFREIIIAATITGTLMRFIMTLPVGLVVVLEVVGFSPGSGIFRHVLSRFGFHPQSHSFIPISMNILNSEH